MKKFYFSFLVLAVLTLVDLYAKTDISLTKTTLSNITTTDNTDGSVTFSLTDAAAQGTVRFDDIADFTTYQTVYFNYRQDNSEAVEYALNNQYVSNARLNYKPATTMAGISSFNVQQAITDGKNMGDSYFTITLKSGTVTIYDVCCTDKIADEDVLLSALAKYTADNGSTFATTTVNSVLQIDGIGKKVVFGKNTTTTDTYFDLSGYDGVKFEVIYPSANVGDSIEIRLQFVNAEGDGFVDKYIEPALETSGAYTVSFATGDAPTQKVAGIKAWSVAGVNFNLIFADLVAYVDNASSIQNPFINSIDDENAIVNVYNLSGSIVKKAVRKADATTGLGDGFYIVGNKKVFVHNR